MVWLGSLTIFITVVKIIFRVTIFDDLKVRLGEHNIKDTSDRYSYEEYEIQDRILHELYDDESQIHDIALLKLKNPVKFREHIVPICLPPQGVRFDGETATVTGWGIVESGMRPASLQEVDVKIIDNDLCQKWLSGIDRRLEVRDTMMCAGFEDGGKDSCQGDSGGPLILTGNGRAQLIGIVSWGFKCGRPKSPGVYTRVSDYVDWIHKTMEVR